MDRADLIVIRASAFCVLVLFAILILEKAQ